MIFSPEDKAVMIAATKGLDPCDVDMDPGNPEVGPDPTIVPRVETFIREGLTELFDWVDSGIRKPMYSPPPRSPGLVRADNDRWTTELFDYHMGG